jgi:hypothetical protein
MKLGEAIGMVAVGAVAAFGATYFISKDPAPQTPAGIAEMAPVNESVAQDVVAVALVETATDDVQVSRAATNLDTFAILAEVMSSHENEDAASAEAIVVLTPEQEQVIEMFRATARRKNENKGQSDDGSMMLNNMAVVGLNVRYYYTIPMAYRELQPELLLDQQRAQVAQTVCASPEIMILMEDYGFDYTYAYLSQDRRLIGQIDASLETCRR